MGLPDLIEVIAFHSPIPDACIHIEKSLVGVDFEIRDLSKTVIRDYPGTALIFGCTQDCANSIILENVRKLKGRVFNESYSKWLDDGFGGIPTTLKTPRIPNTKSKCMEILKKWMKVLR